MFLFSKPFLFGARLFNGLSFRFDREGYDLEYEVEEKGYAQFLCKIHLPIDVPSGVNTVAQATVKGKLIEIDRFMYSY